MWAARSEPASWRSLGPTGAGSRAPGRGTSPLPVVPARRTSMRLYAQRPDLRLRQALGDTGVVAWIVLWVLIARVVHRAVLVLAEPGEAVSDLGGSVARNMASAAETADRGPVGGDAPAKPFQALGDAGDSVSGAGQAAQSAVGSLAFWLAVVLVVLPV